MAKSKKNKRTKKTAVKTAPKVVQQAPDWLYNTSLHSLILVVLSIGIYANTFSHGFAQDDAIVIYDNMFTVEGIEGIPGILKNDTFFGFFKEEGKAQLVSGGRYRPLTLVLFALEVELFGISASIGHIINALFYGLTGLFLYLLLIQLFYPDGADKKNGYFIAFVAALLFVSHPIHTEAVANIKGRDEIITLLGSLMALYYSFRAYRTDKVALHLLVFGLFFLALMAKENAITFLAIVPLSYFFFTKVDANKIALFTLPFLAGAIVFLLIRSQVIPGGFQEPSMELMNNPFLKIEGGQYVSLPFMERMAIIVFTMGKYLQLLVFPVILTHDYYPRQVGLMSWMDWEVLLSLLVYLGLVAYALIRLPKKDPISYCILFFLATFSIVSNVFFPVGTNMSERFMFMPSVGFCLAIAVLLSRFIGLDVKKNLNLGLIGALLIVLLFSIRTIIRNPAWENNFTLFTTDIYNSPNSAKLRNAVGGELITQAVENKAYTEQQRTDMWTEAVGHLQEAIKIHPNYKNSYLLLGNAYNYLKEYDKSIANYQKALKIDSEYQEANTNLIITYRDAGRYYGEQLGDLNKSLQYLELAYAANQRDYETLRLLGVANGIRGDNAKAIDFFTRALELNQQDASAYLNLSTAYFRSGDTEQGQFYQQKALEIDPEVLNNRQ